MEMKYRILLEETLARVNAPAGAAMNTDITAEVREFIGMVKMARDELGVPNEDYPAPVANCAKTIDEAFERLPAALKPEDSFIVEERE